MRLSILMLYLLLIFALAFVGCAASPSSNGSFTPRESAPHPIGSASLSAAAASAGRSHWQSLPERDSLVIYGVSGPQMRRETEITNARLDAARKAALFHGVNVNTSTAAREGTGFSHYFAESTLTLNYDENLETYAGRLSYDPERDITIIDGTVFVRFTYPEAFPGNLNYSFERRSGGRPVWTINRPDRISGFPAGVGYSANLLKVGDTFTKSYESAIGSLASQMPGTVMTEEAVFVDQSRSLIDWRSLGRLNAFLVIEVWIEPDSKGVWTLAVAQIAE